MQIKKDKDYLELETKYQALLKKQQGKGIYCRKNLLRIILTMMMKTQNMQIWP